MYCMNAVVATLGKDVSHHLEVAGKVFLSGEVNISGAKNSALILMAASLLTQEEVSISNIPNLTDIQVMSNLLKNKGVLIKKESNKYILKASNLNDSELPYDLVHALRASFVCIGPLLTRFGEVKIPLPGGCQIGSRPVNEHIRGLEALGAVVSVCGDLVHAKLEQNQKKLKGARIKLKCKSVGATETILMAATLASGISVIENAAQEPEVQDLATMLSSMGAKIYGAGTERITIQGVEALHGCHHEVIPDRIETGTYLIAAAITRSSLSIRPGNPHHLQAVLKKLQECGCKIEVENNSITITPGEIKAVDITTAPYPGFPTDLQAPFMALMATAKGKSKITETIFENRMQHVSELQRMGGLIQLEGNTALITGVKELKSAHLKGGDLRSSAAMVLASLSAQGISTVQGINYLDRGYEKMEAKLNKIGAKILREVSVISSNKQAKVNIQTINDPANHQEVA